MFTSILLVYIGTILCVHDTNMSFSELMYIVPYHNVSLSCPFQSCEGIPQWKGPPNGIVYNDRRKINHNLKDINIHVSLDGEFNLIIYGFNESNEGSYQCSAEQEGNAVTKTFELVLQMNAPKIKITEQNFSDAMVIRRLACEVEEKPGIYINKQWEHLYRGKHIRFLNGFENGTLILPYVNEKGKRYQDSGTYKCLIGNKTIDEQDNKLQSTEIFIQTKGNPVFIRHNANIHYGKYGESIDIQLFIYSIPSLISANLTGKKSTARISLSGKKDRVPDTFHNTTVTLCTYVALFQIVLIDSMDFFTKYTVIATNGYGSSNFTFELRATTCKDCPEIPNIQRVEPGKKSVLIAWNGASNGGSLQTFIIEYKQSSQEIWIEYTNITETTRNEYTTMIGNLLPSEYYDIRMYAVNSINKSNYTKVFKRKTAAGVVSSSMSSILQASIAIGCIVTLTVLVSAGYFLKKSVNASKQPEEREENVQEENAAFNETYELNENRTANGPGVEAAPTVYTTVNRNQDISNICSSHVQTKEIFHRQEISRQGPLVCGGMASLNEHQVTRPVDQGHSELNYIELELKSTQEGCRFYIHGKEDKTEYSEIEFGVVGDRLQTSESEVDDADDDDKTSKRD